MLCEEIYWPRLKKKEEKWNDLAFSSWYMYMYVCRDVKHLIADTKKTAENTFEQADANGERELTLSMHSLKSK